MSYLLLYASLTMYNLSVQIHYVLVQNRQGKTRLAKWYSAFNDTSKIRLLADVYRTMSARHSKFANFVEVRLVLQGRFL